MLQYQSSLEMLHYKRLYRCNTVSKLATCVTLSEFITDGTLLGHKSITSPKLVKVLHFQNLYRHYTIRAYYRCYTIRSYVACYTTKACKGVTLSGFIWCYTIRVHADVTPLVCIQMLHCQSSYRH